MRKIIHIDMDAFFAAVEQRDHPELKGQPVIVGGSPDHRGVVATCSYEARKYGVHSAMPTRTALRLCPNAVLVRTNGRKYKAVSQKIRQILLEVTDMVEPVSIDEAYLDVTENKLGMESAVDVAAWLRRRIFEETGLTCSAGVAGNKFLAKVASDFRKPDGLTEVTPESAQSFLDELPIEKFHGIGKVTADKLKSMNILNGAQLRKLELETLQMLFGKVGEYYYYIVRGVDARPVEVGGEPKSISREITLDKDCSDIRELRIILRTLARKVARRAAAKGYAGGNVTIKIKYADFQTVTRTESRPEPFCDGADIGEYAVKLLGKTSAGVKAVRLAGVGIGALRRPGESTPEQLTFDFVKDS